MNKKQKIKAQDILSDEKFTVESLDSGSKDKKEVHEKKMARSIYDFLSSPGRVSWKAEKEQTKARVERSIQKINRRKYLTRWVAAASIVLIVSSVWVLQNYIKGGTKIIEYAQSLNVSEPDSVTNLILQDGRKVFVTEKESRIVYDTKGENIAIDSAQQVSQEVIQEKPVFNTLIVPYGKRSQVTLSDGSKVWLNSGSKLIYLASKTKGKREAYLEGEAVFDITHSKQGPFFVRTKDFEIKVLGTVFNVSAYPDDKNSSTVLAKGRIELESTEKSIFHKEKLSILPGTRAVFNSDEKTFQQQQVNTDYYLSWRDGYFVCNKEPLQDILKKLERYYNVPIVLQDAQLGQETFSGNLDLKNTPAEVLSTIAETMPFSVKHENEKLIINQK